MFNLSDKEIDRLSREASDSYEPDYSSLSWNRLEQKLDQQMPGRPPDPVRRARPGPWFWAPVLFMISGISFWMIKNNFYSANSTRNLQTQSAVVSKNKSVAPGDSSAAASSSGSLAAANASYAKSRKRNASGNTGRNNSESNAAGNDAAGNNAAGNNATGNTVTGGKAAALLAFSGSVRASGQDIYSGNRFDAPGTGSTPNKSSGLVNGTQVSTDINAKIFGLPEIVTTLSAVRQIKGSDSLATAAAGKIPAPQKIIHLNRSFNVGLAFGPDFTHASSVPNNQFGNNLGITTGYYITGRLSVNSGLIYSNKFYWSSPEKHTGYALSAPSYAPGPIQGGNVALFAAAPAVEYVNSSASIWELPLTLRFDVASHKKTKFFVNGGLSSYFIVKQKSIYFSHSGQRAMARERTDASTDNNWFNVVNLSVGLETDIGKGLSFQVEPFAKLPFKKMGTENVFLTSYGMLLSFRFSPVLSRTKK